MSFAVSFDAVAEDILVKNQAMLDGIKQKIILDVYRARKQAESLWGLKESDFLDFLIVKSRTRTRVTRLGNYSRTSTAYRERRLRYSSLDPRYLTIGTERQPLSFEWVVKTGDWETVMQAVAFTLKYLRDIAPALTGEYRNSFRVMLDNRDISRENYTKETILKRLKDDSVVRIINIAEYASTIEAGFYKKVYKTANAKSLHSGIMLRATRNVRRMANYRSKVAMRFTYLGAAGNPNDAGQPSTGTQTHLYNYPCIEFGLYGSMPINDARPGQRISRFRSRLSKSRLKRKKRNG